MTDPNEYALEQMSIEPAYEKEGVSGRPFYSFESRFGSLNRHWKLQQKLLKHHISLLNTADFRSECQSLEDVFSETAETDCEEFPEFLKLTVISVSLSLVETLLTDIAEDIAKLTGQAVNLEQRKMPYINKYLLWLMQSCGIEISIDKAQWKSLDTIREIRNQYLHKLGRDLPDQIKKVYKDMASSTIDGSTHVSDVFVNNTISQISNLVKTIELACIEFTEKELSRQRKEKLMQEPIDWDSLPSWYVYDFTNHRNLEEMSEDEIRHWIEEHEDEYSPAELVFRVNELVDNSKQLLIQWDEEDGHETYLLYFNSFDAYDGTIENRTRGIINPILGKTRLLFVYCSTDHPETEADVLIGVSAELEDGNKYDFLVISELDEE